MDCLQDFLLLKYSQQPDKFWKSTALPHNPEELPSILSFKLWGTSLLRICKFILTQHFYNQPAHIFLRAF